MKAKTMLGWAVLCVLIVATVIYIARAPVCDHNNGVALKVTDVERTQIARLFRDHSIYRRGNLIILYMHNDKLKNVFYFERKQNDDTLTLEFLSDSLEFQPSLNPEVMTPITVNEDNKKRVLEAYVHKLVAKMDSLKISDFTAEFSRFGIDLEILFSDWSRLIYVSDLLEINNSQWKSYVAKSKKIDENWYYYCE